MFILFYHVCIWRLLQIVSQQKVVFVLYRMGKKFMPLSKLHLRLLQVQTLIYLCVLYRHK